MLINDFFIYKIKYVVIIIVCFIYLVKEEDQSSEPDPDESSYQSSPHAVLETTGSSISTDSDTSGIEWQSLNHNGILCFSCCSYFNFLFFLHIKLSYLFLFKKKKKERERTRTHYYGVYPPILVQHFNTFSL